MRTLRGHRRRATCVLLTAVMAALATGCGGGSTGGDPACAAPSPATSAATESTALATEPCEDTGGSY